MPPFKNLEPAEIANILESSATAEVLDVREPDEWDVCHLNGARLRPLSELRYWQHHLRADGGPYIVYCHHGVRSYQVCTYLSGLGIRNLINMKGGIDRWSRTVDGTVPTY